MELTLNSVDAINISPMSTILGELKRRVKKKDKTTRTFVRGLWDYPNMRTRLEETIINLKKESLVYHPYGDMVLDAAGRTAERLYRNKGQWPTIKVTWMEEEVPTREGRKRLGKLEPHARHVTELVLAFSLVDAYHKAEKPTGYTNVTRFLPMGARTAIKRLQEELRNIAELPPRVRRPRCGHCNRLQRLNVQR